MTDMSSHPDLEALSAMLDGEAPEVEAHVIGCGTCTATLQHLRSIASAVADVPPATPEHRDTAIVAALAAWESPTAADAAGAPTAPAPGWSAAPSTPQEAVGARPEPPTVVPFRRPRGAGAWAAVASIAAVAVAVVGAAGLLRPESAKGSKDLALTRPETQTVERSEQDTSAGAEDARGGATVGGAPARAAAPPMSVFGAAQQAPLDLGDLGAVDDRAALAARFAARLASTGDHRSGATVAPDEVGPPCLPEASALQQSAGGGALRYWGSGTIDGRPAAVLGFIPPEGRPVTLVVAERDDCRVRYVEVVP